MAEAIAKDGVRISYDDRGQGEPALLFLPAWCMSRAGFAQVPEYCANNRRVLTLDWRGHGASETPKNDFGAADLVEDALAVVNASGAQQVIPVSLSHGGRVALDVRRRLGERVPKIVVIDWLLLDPPPEYVDLVKGLDMPDKWEQTRDILFSIWLTGVDNQDVIRFVREEMGSYGADMWMRSGREIGGGYAKAGSPLNELATLNPPVPVLHIYAQPDDPGYLAAQQSFATDHPWFHVHKLQAHGHFPTFEVPGPIAAAIESFVA